MEMIEVILDNTYVRFAGFTFRQTSGIPMGGNASPLLADLTLSVREFKYMKQASSAERKAAGINVRYFDDIFNMNGDNFMEISKEVYPVTLPLEETTTKANGSDFLDLTVTLQDARTHTTLYNKTDAFSFSVIRLPEASSDIHINTGYNTFYSQSLRIARICSTKLEFENKIESLCKEFINKGYNRIRLLQMTRKFIKNYKSIIISLGYTNSQMLMVFKRQM